MVSFDEFVIKCKRAQKILLQNTNTPYSETVDPLRSDDETINLCSVTVKEEIVDDSVKSGDSDRLGDANSAISKCMQSSCNVLTYLFSETYFIWFYRH